MGFYKFFDLKLNQMIFFPKISIKMNKNALKNFFKINFQFIKFLLS